MRQQKSLKKQKTGWTEVYTYLTAQITLKDEATQLILNNVDCINMIPVED